MAPKKDKQVEAAIAEQKEGEVAEKAELNAIDAAAAEEAARKAAASSRKELTDDEIKNGNFLVRHNHDGKSIEYLDQRGDIVAIRKRPV